MPRQNDAIDPSETLAIAQQLVSVLGNQVMDECCGLLREPVGRCGFIGPQEKNTGCHRALCCRVDGHGETLLQNGSKAIDDRPF